jgi:hypothetical protein
MMENWQAFWHAIFFIASGLFYLIVIAVAFKGMGDMSALIGELRRGNKKS